MNNDATRNARREELAAAIYWRRWQDTSLKIRFADVAREVQQQYLNMADAALELFDKWGAAGGEGLADTKPDAAPQHVSEVWVDSEDVGYDDSKIPF